MTHTELVKRAARWLRSQKHPLVIQEIGSHFEMPDVIGWRWNGRSSTLIECKTTVEDFRRDAKKPFRIHPEMGLGRERWYFVPEEISNKILDEIPSRWGLLVVGRKVAIAKRPTAFVERNMQAEMCLLVSATRRVTEQWGRKVFGEITPQLVDGDPHPTTAKIIADLRAENRALRNRGCAEYQ